VPEAVRRSMELWVGCVAGALEEDSYREKLAEAGDARQFLDEAGLSDDDTLAQVDGRFMSAFVRAQKPASVAQTCCASTCCA
jgi:arsenite methyltransferase